MAAALVSHPEDGEGFFMFSGVTAEVPISL